MSESTDLAKIDKAIAAAVAEYPGLDIPFGLTASDADSADISSAIEARLLKAKTLDDIYAAGEVTKWEEVTGKVLTVTDYRYAPSDFDPVWPWVLVNAVDESGNAYTIGSGGRNVVVTMALCRANDLFPAVFRFGVAEKHDPGKEPAHTLTRP